MIAENLPKLKLAVDYDGVIADTNSIKAEWIKANLGLNIPTWRCDDTSLVPGIMDQRQHQKMARVVYGKSSSLMAQPVSGAIDGLHTLSRIAALYIVTARPPSRLQWAREWIKSHGLGRVISGIVSTQYPSKRTKKDICIKNGFHLLIDDDRGWIDDFADLRIPVIFFKSGLPQSEQEKIKALLLPRIECVDSWSKIVDFIKDIERKRRADCN